MTSATLIWSAMRVVALCLALLACSGKTTQDATSPSQPPPQAATSAPAGRAVERPLAAESNPPGDIPDTQRFVDYSVPGAYSVEAPEGWARTVRADSSTFTDKFDGEQITLASASKPPGASKTSPAVTALLTSARAVRDADVRNVVLPRGPAVQVSFTSNSAIDPVTGKQVRLLNTAYLFHHGGHTATVRLWAPLGSDNVDQWNRILQSFRWL